jgi:hypothetical protein
VLRPEEVAAIQERVAAYNAIIVQTADAFGLPVFDANAVLADLINHGITLGGAHLDGSYLTGGLVSYDAIHPQQLGYAVFTKYLVDFLNDTLNARLTPVDLSEIMFDNPCYPLGSAYGVAPESVEFSPEAMQSFLELFMPELPHVLPRDQEAAAATD